jgi:hypothetical protein
LPTPDYRAYWVVSLAGRLSGRPKLVAWSLETPMTSFILIVAFCLIGVPGIAFVVLQLIAAHKRQNLAYGWNAADLQRRGRRIAELEQQCVNERKAIAELTLKISAQRMAVDRLEKLIGKSDPAAAQS